MKTPRWDLFPVAILNDRYQGTYSGGEWVAVAGAYPTRIERLYDLEAFAGDIECEEFWKSGRVPLWVAVGATPEAALAALEAKIPEGSNWKETI